MHLAELLKTHKLTQREFGKLLEPKASQGLVWQWLNGRTRITLAHANVIIEKFPGQITHAELEALFKQPLEQVNSQAIVEEAAGEC